MADVVITTRRSRGRYALHWKSRGPALIAPASDRSTNCWETLGLSVGRVFVTVLVPPTVTLDDVTIWNLSRIPVNCAIGIPNGHQMSWLERRMAVSRIIHLINADTRWFWSRIAIENFNEVGIIALTPFPSKWIKKSDPETRTNTFLEGKLEIR